MEIVPQVPCCLPVWYLDSPQQRDIFNSRLRRICSWFSTTPDPFLYNSFPASCSSFFIYAVDSACLREASCTSPSSISAHLPQVAEIILNSVLAVQRAQLPPSQLTDTFRVGIINEQPAAQGSSNTTLLIRKLITAFHVEVSNNFAHTHKHTHTRCHRSLQTVLSLLLRISGETGSEDFPKSSGIQCFFPGIL